MGIKTYQEKNAKSMEKELAPTHQWREKSQKLTKNTIFQESGIFGWFFGFFSSLVCRIELILFPMLLHFSPSVWYPYIKFTTTFFFGPIMGKSKSNMAGWGPKFQDQAKSAFDSVNQHIWPYETACKTLKSWF